jgi:LysM repeat protein
MTITRKDTIVLAVLFNIVILAGVLTTARQLSSKPEAPIRESGSCAALQCSENTQEIADREEPAQSFDEIDQLLEDYIAEDAHASAPASESKKPAKNAVPSDEYYIVKAGDNPWKIAKKFHLSFEKLLQLNHLDEAKARNLKVGSRLRIREQKS